MDAQAFSIQHPNIQRPACMRRQRRGFSAAALTPLAWLFTVPNSLASDERSESWLVAGMILCVLA